jgi:serine/threonine-protein kinase
MLTKGIAGMSRAYDAQPSMVSIPASRMSATAPVNPGDVVAGKYRIERVLATGGMGVIVEATHLHLDERVAMKFLLPALAQNEEARARFLREARAAAKMRNEHVVRVADAGVAEGGQTFMVMELLDGKDLDCTIQERGKLPVEEAVDVVLQACEGLADAHRLGIVHRDLKPANLFLVRRANDTPVVKLLDFGISKQNNHTDVSMTRTAAVVGSPLYMSPEQLRSSRSVDARSDIWSLGVILYESLTGTSPFTAEAIAVVHSKILNEAPPPLVAVPGELAAIVVRCLAKEVEGRFASVADLAKALRPFAGTDGKLAADRIFRTLRGALADSSPDGPAPADPLTVAQPPVEAASSLEAKGAVGRKTVGDFSSTASSNRGQSQQRLIVGATLGTLALVGVLALALRGGSRDATPAAAPAAGAPVSAVTAPAALKPEQSPPPSPSPAEAAPVVPTPVPVPTPVTAAAGTSGSAKATVAPSTPIPAATVSTPAIAPKRAAVKRVTHGTFGGRD